MGKSESVQKKSKGNGFQKDFFFTSRCGPLACSGSPPDFMKYAINARWAATLHLGNSSSEHNLGGCRLDITPCCSLHFFCTSRLCEKKEKKEKKTFPVGFGGEKR
ncbi:MAG: hypothetical protein FWH21_03095 [Kiritimatiellaeota bacterium]|nr:hypothetical protein [Kiritimatiellota bacterium]